MLKNYKQNVLRVIEKTGNPVAPFALQNLANGIEQTAKCISHLCNQDQVLLLQKRLLKDFTDEELNKIANSPNFILALLAMTKESINNFPHSQ